MPTKRTRKERDMEAQQVKWQNINQSIKKYLLKLKLNAMKKQKFLS